MSTPTDEEIAQTLYRRWEHGMESSYPGDMRASLRGMIRECASPLTNPAWLALEATSEYSPEVPDPDDLWYNLRGTEARRLHQLVEDAVARAAIECEEAIEGALTAAGVAFAAEYPDAPRAVPAAA